MSREVIHVYDGQDDRHLPVPSEPEPPVAPPLEAFWAHQEEKWRTEEACLKRNRDLLNERELDEVVEPPDYASYHISQPALVTPIVLSTPLSPTKIDWSHIPWDALEEVALAMDIGAQKHPDEDDYLAGLRHYTEIASGLLRHYAAWAKGENVDADGFHHLAGVAARCFMLIALHKRGRTELDDRQ